MILHVLLCRQPMLPYTAPAVPQAGLLLWVQAAASATPTHRLQHLPRARCHHTAF